MIIIANPMKEYKGIYTSGLLVDSASPETSTYLHGQLTKRIEVTVFMEKLIAPKVSGNMPKAEEDSCDNPHISDPECAFQFILDEPS